MEGLRPGNLDELFLGKFGRSLRPDSVGPASRSQPGHTECRQFGSQHHKLRLIESTPPAPKPFPGATPTDANDG